MPEDLIKAMNKTDSFTIKIQIDLFDTDRLTSQDDPFDNTQDDNQTQCDDVDNSENESYDKLYSSQQLDGMESNTIFIKRMKFY